MRPLDKVIDATLKLIPQDFPNRADLEKGLQSIKDSYAYSAPEMYAEWWYKFASLLNHTLGEPDAQWKEEIVLLLQGKKDYLEVLNA